MSDDATTVGDGGTKLLGTLVGRDSTDEPERDESSAVVDRLSEAARRGRRAHELEQLRTVNVRPDLAEDAFFAGADGDRTIATRYDLEKAVSFERKRHFVEVERYWVDRPYAFVVIFHSVRENEKKYYLVEPYRNDQEEAVGEFLTGKLRNAIRYSGDEVVLDGTPAERRAVIESQATALLERYRIADVGPSALDRLLGGLADLLDVDAGSLRNPLAGDGGDREQGRDAGAERDPGDSTAAGTATAAPDELGGAAIRPEPAVLAEEAETLTGHQVEKLLYYLKRDFVGYERIDGIKHDVGVEDISCDGYDSPVFVYHSEYEQIITNVRHGERGLDRFVVKLAQRSGKGISKRRPQVNATLPDGSRAQLTLGREVSDHGTNYTIRQFKDVPFTPVDLINWNTFSLEEMAFLWLCIENNKSLIFAGGTASGKTTSLNAISLFIPSSAKIVSIEDTREVELPQRNWVASVTRPGFSADATGEIDEFSLLEAALRQRPEYIVMGEVRGEEGRTLFQIMSTGHTTLTTFHADSVDEVIKRFTTDPINVSKTLFTALDLVSVQTQTRVRGEKVRRSKTITEINEYEAEYDDVGVQDVFQWQAETDEFLRLGQSRTLEEIAFDRGWSAERVDRELQKRRVVLAYLVDNDLNEYAEVAATLLAFINDPETVLTLIANGTLEERLMALRKMESVLIDIDPAKEAMVPRPEPSERTREAVEAALADGESLLAEYRGREPRGLAGALSHLQSPEVTHEQLLQGGDPVEADGGTTVDDRPTASDRDGGSAANDEEGRPAVDGARPAPDSDDRRPHDRSQEQ